MKRIAIFGIILSVLFSSVITTKANAIDLSSGQVKVNSTHQIKLNYAKDMEDLTNENILKGNKEKVGLTKEKYKNTFINLNIKIEENNSESYFDVHTVTKVNDDNYKGNYNGSLEKFTGEEGIYYYGPLEGTSETKGGSEDSILGLYFNPSTKNAIVTISIGEISEKGIGSLFFGDHTELSKAEINKAEELIELKNNKNTVVQTSNLVTPKLAPTMLKVATSISSQDVSTHMGTDDVGYLGKGGTETLPTTFTNIGETTGVTNFYSSNNSDGTTTVTMRTFSNISVVESYLRDPLYAKTTARAQGLNMLFTGSTNLDVLEDEVWPAAGIGLNILEKWWYLEIFLKEPLKLVAEQLTFKPNVTHVKDVNVNNNALYYFNVKVRNGLGTEIDLPSGTTIGNSYKTNGGFVTHFTYRIKGSNSGVGAASIEPVTRINYSARFENNYQNPNSSYTAYYWTGRMMEVKWTD
ncbi:hypothetical protein V1503_24520 [Bacillus sp. SCS-151]|uniref:hypothetical protein n=1 Tax=Nanhaiella sioensis TaxID=3115293 RepID=UPI00397E8F4B